MACLKYVKVPEAWAFVQDSMSPPSTRATWSDQVKEACRSAPMTRGVFRSKDPVWRILETDLGTDLQYRPDPARPGHGFVEPNWSMTLAEYQRVLAQTQRQWQKI